MYVIGVRPGSSFGNSPPVHFFYLTEHFILLFNKALSIGILKGIEWSGGKP